MNIIEEMKTYREIVSEANIKAYDALFKELISKGASVDDLVKEIPAFFKKQGDPLSPAQMASLEKKAQEQVRIFNKNAKVGPASTASTEKGASKLIATGGEKSNIASPRAAKPSGPTNQMEPSTMEPGEPIQPNRIEPSPNDIPGELVQPKGVDAGKFLVPVKQAIENNPSPEKAAEAISKIPGIKSVLGGVIGAATATGIVAAAKKFINNTETSQKSTGTSAAAAAPATQATVSKQTSAPTTSSQPAASAPKQQGGAGGLSSQEEMELHALAFDLEKMQDQDPNIAKMLEPYYKKYGH